MRSGQRNSPGAVLLPLLAGLLAVAAPAPVRADDPSTADDAAVPGRLPVAQAQRPLTLPRLVLAPELDFDATRIGALTTSGVASQVSVFANGTIGAAFGIADDLTARITVLPLQLLGPSGTSIHYGQTTGLDGVDTPGFAFGATYRLSRGPVEVGLAYDMSIITAIGVSGLTATPGIPLRVHLGKSGRFDTGAYVPIVDTVSSASGLSTTTLSVGLNVPVSLLFDVSEQVHLGMGSGVGFVFNPPLGTSLGQTLQIPLGFFAGFVVAQGKDGPLLDLDPFFTWPVLFTPGATGFMATTTNTGFYSVGLRLVGYLYL